MDGRPEVRMYPVLTRVPRQEDEALEQRLLDSVIAFMNADAADLASSLEISSRVILHSEPAIELDERIRIGGDVPRRIRCCRETTLRCFANCSRSGFTKIGMTGQRHFATSSI